MAALRNRTRTAHESMERCLQLPSQLKELRRYRSLLERFYGFFLPVETAMRWTPGIVEVLPDLEDRLRAHLLARDLSSLGVSNRAIQNLPRCQQLPPVATSAQALGCLYVLEGSTLGGQMIAREVRSLAPRFSKACVFFLSDGDDVSTRWKSFGLAAETYAAGHPEQTDEIVNAASETFACLEKWLSNA